METTATVKISDKEAQDAVASAVAALFTPEILRDELSATIARMMAPNNYGYGGASRMQDLFKQAIEKRISEEMDRLLVENAEARKGLEDLVLEGIRSLLGNDELRKKTVAGLAGAFSDRMSKRA